MASPTLLIVANLRVPGHQTSRFLKKRHRDALDRPLLGEDRYKVLFVFFNGFAHLWPKIVTLVRPNDSGSCGAENMTEELFNDF